ncbi:hypothetical protein [Micrococcus luteus]
MLSPQRDEMLERPGLRGEVHEDPPRCGHAHPVHDPHRCVGAEAV